MSSDKAAEKKSRRRRAGGGSKSRVKLNNTWLKMENILEKLSILDYEAKFCTPNVIKPFPRTMFAMKAAGGITKSVQFQQFMKIVTWLFVESGREQFSIDRFDDPTTSVNKVMLELKNMDFEMDYPVNQLLDGQGEAVCAVLHFLTDKALEQAGFDWKKRSNPDYPQEDFAEEAEVDEDADVGAIEDDIASDSDENQDEDLMYVDMVQGNVEDKDEDDAAATALIEAEVDTVKWKTELERVRPKLKVKLVTHDKEWRAHLDQTKIHEKAIKKTLPSVLKQLKGIEAGIVNSMDRLERKERHINQICEQMSTEYRDIQQRLKEINNRYSHSSEKIQELTNAYALISDKLEDVQTRQEEKGSSMTNTGPLVRMKKAIQKLKDDRNQMELRIGVVSHTLMLAEMAAKVDDEKDEDSDSDYDL